MYGKKVKLRFLFLTFVLLSVILSAFLILQSLKENVVYFQSPSEIKSLVELEKKKLKDIKRYLNKFEYYYIKRFAASYLFEYKR